MSLLSDTLFSGGSSRLHIEGGGVGGRARNAPRTVRKSQSHAGFFSPLVQLVRDPVGTLGGTADCDYVPDVDAGAVDSSCRQVLYLHMKDAETYDEWKAAATELDTLEGNEAWKEQDESTEYNAELIAARLQELDDARTSCDVKRMLFLIRTTLIRGLGNMGHLSLYKHSHIGTKRLIERYIESAQLTLAALLDISEKQGDQCPVEPRCLIDQLLQTRQSFGRSALLLSGGGTFGMNHIGVIAGLWDAHLLPRIISGASAGSIVSAVLCTRTDAEMPQVLHQFCYGDLNVFGDPDQPDGVMGKAMRLLKSGVLFDISHLTRVMRDLLGDMTFQEAYNRTRRILNIPVSSSSLYELPRLLNYITAPNVMIWSAVCASCSVPLVYKEASLLAKDPRTGAEVPWNPNPNATWIDGSVDNDLPMTRLAEMFNVNHFIVSQVNPHVIPFLAKEEEIMTAEARQRVATGSSWVSLSASLCKGEVMHRLQQIADTGIFPNLVTKGRSILSQRYSGDINIFPKISYADFPRVLSNPTPEYMKGCMLAGRRATWPKLSRIQNHVAIELALDDTIQKLKGQLVFLPSQKDLGMRRTSSQGNVLSHRQKSHKTARFAHRTEPPSPVLQTRTAASRGFPLHLPSHAQIHTANRSLKRRSTTNTPATTRPDAYSSTASTSDQDYFGDPDSDTTGRASSPSPLTSPTYQVPTLWPSTTTPPALMRGQSHTQQHTSPPPPPCPPTTTSTTTTPVNRRTGTLLNLTMTSASSKSTLPNAPSSPELRYKRLFHPPGPATPDVCVGPPVLESDATSKVDVGDGKMESGSKPGSRQGSRRSSVVDRGAAGLGLGLGMGVMGDYSGTRAMLLRKKSFVL